MEHPRLTGQAGKVAPEYVAGFVRQRGNVGGLEQPDDSPAVLNKLYLSLADAA